MNNIRLRRREIKRKRTLAALKAHKTKLKLRGEMPLHAIEADQSKIEMGNSYGPCPRYYVDYIYSCIDCGKKSLWTAEQQKWWYEEAKGNIN